MTEQERYNLIHPDTSAYAYDGSRVNPYAYTGGRVVDNYNEWEVEDFNFDPDGFDPDGYDPLEDYISKQTSLPFDPDSYDPGTPYDSLFGNKKKKAERKIAKAEKQLEKGHTKAAARKLAKGTAILNKIQAGQQATAAAQQQVQDTRTAQDQLAQNQSALSNPIQPLSSQPMSDIGSSMNNTGGGSMSTPETSGNIGADSAAPSTATNPDDPTGWLADEKTLDNVTVVSGKKGNKNMALILIGVVILVIAIVYFAPKFMKK